MARPWDELEQIAAAVAELYRHNPVEGAAAMAVGLHMAQRQLLIDHWRREAALDPALEEGITNRTEQLQIQKDPSR